MKIKKRYEKVFEYFSTKIIKFARSQQIPSGLSEIRHQQKGQFGGYKA